MPQFSSTQWIVHSEGHYCWYRWCLNRTLAYANWMAARCHWMPARDYSIPSVWKDCGIYSSCRWPMQFRCRSVAPLVVSPHHAGVAWKYHWKGYSLLHHKALLVSWHCPTDRFDGWMAHTRSQHEYCQAVDSRLVIWHIVDGFGRNWSTHNKWIHRVESHSPAWSPTDRRNSSVDLWQ